MKRVQEIRRKCVQIAAFGFNNSALGNIADGKLYSGSWKKFCSPGLNCYSCPAARLSCPIGAMQAVSGTMEFRFSFYALGMILAVGVVFGRAVCGWVCPFGLLQELLYRIGGLFSRAVRAIGKSVSWRERRKIRLWKPLTCIKYVLLAVFVVILPALVTDPLGIGEPAFCQYICPAGTLEAGIPLLLTHPELWQALGGLFALKAGILAGVIAGCASVRRFFCKVMCPLGAVYGLLNRVSLFRLSHDPGQCVSCGTCAAVCPMDVDPVHRADSAECIRCGRCAAACPESALQLGFLSAPGNQTKRRASAG